MKLSRVTKSILSVFAALALFVLYLPLFIVFAASFNTAKQFSIPDYNHLTLTWWHRAWASRGARDSLFLSLRIAIVATLIALVIGTLAALALNRTKFFGRTSLNLFIVLPISLPGVVTGIALATTFLNVGFALGFFTVVVAHATFCIVVIFNNVFARLRRIGPSLSEASSDLGAGQWRTFRSVTFPMMSSALVAGALLSIALSFDEIVVTTFTNGPGSLTLPQWIFNNIKRPNQLPIVNVVATVVILASIIPVIFAQKLTSDD